jgi:hypothetical protein
MGRGLVSGGHLSDTRAISEVRPVWGVLEF